MCRHKASTALLLALMPLLAFAAADADSGGAVDVPLSLWSHPDFPDGLPIGSTNGISWGDYDADGYIDLFAAQSGNLWRNVGGVSWVLAENLGLFLPYSQWRYGSSFGDYDNDGLPDIAIEPRAYVGDNGFHLLNNLGGGPNFVDVATDPVLVDVQPFGDSETLCWGDVDDDGNLDLFIPVYPTWEEGNPGNFFLFNLGPTGPNGDYRFTEMSAEAGLDNPPPDSAKPEGAQFADIDFDGDIDLYSNGTLYRNVSSRGRPLFEGMTETASGIGPNTSRDEGAIFFDYDLDGDDDLIVAYVEEGVRIWENRGDGSFAAAETGIVDEPLIGLNLGVSAEDWDNDGDIDFTTRQIFRRNMLIEEGTRHFTVATHSIPAEHRNWATPAWGDWDKDGDLDCALGNWADEGHFYVNDLYAPQTPLSERRHVRVRAVGDSPSVPGGLEVAYGATVELKLRNGTDGFRRRKFVASSHGYLNQNEYTLHFALPEDPAPLDPTEDLRFDLTADFPTLPSEGAWRVDRHVNPALGEIDLATLNEREIRVYRCGRVVIDGELHEPIPLASPRLTSTTGGLALATPTAALDPLTPAPGPNSWIGLAFDTRSATRSVRIQEILLDGQLDSPDPCGSAPFNLAVWDVTGSSPFLVSGATLGESTSSRNRRSYFDTEIVLEPGREYRLVARVTEFRGSPIDVREDEGSITVLGGILYHDNNPCNGPQAAQPDPDPSVAYLSFRFSSLPTSESEDPVGDRLMLDTDGAGGAVLTWPDLQAGGYQVLRCSAESAACTPELHAVTAESTYSDVDSTPAPGEHVWYEVRAVNECTAALIE